LPYINFITVSIIVVPTFHGNFKNARHAYKSVANPFI
jgi:hypothetical protein